MLCRLCALQSKGAIQGRSTRVQACLEEGMGHGRQGRAAGSLEGGEQALPGERSVLSSRHISALLRPGFQLCSRWRQRSEQQFWILSNGLGQCNLQIWRQGNCSRSCKQQHTNEPVRQSVLLSGMQRAASAIGLATTKLWLVARGSSPEAMMCRQAVHIARGLSKLCGQQHHKSVVL